ncbi:uncharacterized protein LOC141631608 [Silene latifolia]|uniref:uncharacterized protein LOC141631608 n=1 Tax=Silene latifolia TaxID=37657 RepID=UPI003D77CFEB
MVVVPKKNEKWRVCVEFTDLNKACPKDPFPLPHIDAMMDATAGHEMLTFLDAWSGYGQIKMDPADQEKTAFMFERGIYCYNVMPFGLKNAGGIEANTEQIKAVLQLESPDQLKDVQRLAGKVAALSRFISRSLDKCRLFYDILRKRQKFEWTADHEQGFRELKHYLSTPPLLSKPEQGEPLFLYLAVTEVAVSAVLVREQDKEQNPVYYMHIDGASNQRGEGVGLILRSVEGELIAQTVRCEFKATNNETEYEALILGMQLVLELGVRNLKISSDSLLIVNHVNDEFIARDSKMITYLKVAKELKQKFKDCKFKQIPRNQNVEVDALATLGTTFKPTELSNIPITHMLEPSIQKLEEEMEDQQDGAAVQSTTNGQATVRPDNQSDGQIATQLDDQPADQADDWDWRTPYLDWLRTLLTVPG